MKVYGYVRDKDGRFDRRKEKVIEFAKLMELPLDKVICEKSSEEYEDMEKAKELIENERDFILIVSDTSDLFEDLYSRVQFSKGLEEKNIFLIDTYYPNFDYRMLIEKNCKNNPSSFLMSAFISTFEAYMRKKNSDSADDTAYSDMRMRLDEWKRNI